MATVAVVAVVVVVVDAGVATTAAITAAVAATGEEEVPFGVTVAVEAWDGEGVGAGGRAYWQRTVRSMIWFSTMRMRFKLLRLRTWRSTGHVAAVAVLSHRSMHLRQKE